MCLNTKGTTFKATVNHTDTMIFQSNFKMQMQVHSMYALDFASFLQYFPHGNQHTASCNTYTNIAGFIMKSVCVHPGLPEVGGGMFL
jgi:hypothetical protein